MEVQVDNHLPDTALRFLKRGYLFINKEWQHIHREPTGDQGFERHFRESCVTNFPNWIISQEREMRLGQGLETASGVLHEVDLVAQTSNLVVVVEIKNRLGRLPEKNDVIIFFAKILDYLAFNPILLMREVLPTFMSSSSFEESGLATCLGLGIHPIAPELRPLPVLVDSTLRMDKEIQTGLSLPSEVMDEFEEFCVKLNRLSVDLNETWLTNRCGFHSEDTITMKAVGGIRALTLSGQLRQLNADCTGLLSKFREAKAGSRA